MSGLIYLFVQVSKEIVRQLKWLSTSRPIATWNAVCLAREAHPIDTGRRHDFCALVFSANAFASQNSRRALFQATLYDLQRD
jgi:hypothetical protein